MSSLGSVGCAVSMVVNEVAVATERESHIMSKRHFRVNSAAVLVLFGGVACLNVGCSSEAADCSETATCNGATTQEGAASASDAAAGVDGGRDAGSRDAGSVLATVAMEAGADAAPADGASISDARDSGVDGFDGCLAASTPDLPDDNFEDTNCDGIDGDKSAAIFVAATGSDSAIGTMDAPVATINKAVALAESANKAVYVCNGTYAEQVSITSAVSLYGGYDCTRGWKRISDRAVVAPTTGTALVIKDITRPMTIDRFTFRSADAIDPGTSSIAARVVGSAGNKFLHTSFEAGWGADGASAAFVSGRNPAPGGMNGGDLMHCECQVPTTTTFCRRYGRAVYGLPPGYSAADYCAVGALGGDGGNVNLGVATTRGETALGGAPGGEIGFGGAAGTNGEPGVAGTAAARGVGSIDPNGEYQATNVGGNGTPGMPGQAGGGGSGGCTAFDEFGTFFFAGGGGGGGGHGGCGGGGGKGGGAGGASIAVLLANSPNVTFSRSYFTTSSGGRGGSPSAGTPGQQGGPGGLGGMGTAFDGDGYAGGLGGSGGHGGAGGPGGGGPSIAILASGSQPVVIAPTFAVGVGGKGAAGVGAGDAPDGVSGDVVVLDVDGTITGGGAIQAQGD
jgi:hypothetical protein